MGTQSTWGKPFHKEIVKGKFIMAELQRGLEGVIAAETKISSIIDSQLTYAGYDIDDLAENAQFEEIIFLLWNYRLPTKDELQELKSNYMSI